MTVTVRFFATYAEKLGRSLVEIPLSEGDTIGDVLKSVAALPGGDSLPASPLVAVNHAYASISTILVSGDEVAVIPPVAGG